MSQHVIIIVIINQKPKNAAFFISSTLSQPGIEVVTYVFYVQDYKRQTPSHAYLFNFCNETTH